MENWRIAYFHILFSVLTGAGNIVCFDTTTIPLQSTGRLLCKLSVSNGQFHRVKWFKSSLDDVYKKGGPALVSWDGTSQPYTIDNYGIDEDYSLVIYNTLILDEGLYQCEITTNFKSDPHFFEYDIRLVVRALPSKAPLIQRVNDTFIRCSVDGVYPLLYPHIEFEHEEYAVQNTDGTYNTSVWGSIKDAQILLVVNCSFPYFNYSKASSLSLDPTTSTPFRNDEPYPTTHTEYETLEPPNQGTNTSIRVLIPVLVAAAVIGVICSLALLLRRKFIKARPQKPISSNPTERSVML